MNLCQSSAEYIIVRIPRGGGGEPDGKGNPIEVDAVFPAEAGVNLMEEYYAYDN